MIKLHRHKDLRTIAHVFPVYQYDLKYDKYFSIFPLRPRRDYNSFPLSLLIVLFQQQRRVPLAIHVNILAH